MLSDPLSRRQRQLIDSTRRVRPVLIAFVVVGAALALASASYSIDGLQKVSRDPLAPTPPVPAHLTPLVGALGPRLPWVVPPETCEEREELLMGAQEENARLRAHLVLVMWYGLAGAVGASLGLLLGGLSLNSLQWMDIVRRLESGNKP
jgi:hypothetical protein